MATKSKKKVFVKLQCATCKEINYYPHKSLGKGTEKDKERKLALMKFCSSCRKHMEHKEARR